MAVSSGFSTGCTAKTCGCRQNGAMARKITGCPPIERYCFGPPAPARSPRPAATRMAAVLLDFTMGLKIRVACAQALSRQRPENRDIGHAWRKAFLLHCTCTLPGIG